VAKSVRDGRSDVTHRRCRRRQHRLLRGGCLALAGRNVTLLLRPTLAQAIAQNGLRISDLDGADRALPPTALALATDPKQALAEAQIILVTVKSGATAEMADLIARHAPSDAVVVSLQNGVGNLDALRARLGASRNLIPGMVPFNVVQTRNGNQRPRLHRATSGTMLIAARLCPACAMHSTCPAQRSRSIPT
jgi:2-dehydropantoate 2-reductase